MCNDKHTVIEVSVPFVDQELAIDCVEEFLDEGAEIETFVAWMIQEGYDMSIFTKLQADDPRACPLCDFEGETEEENINHIKTVHKNSGSQS